MSTAATAAAIGIKITAINDASRTLAQISRDVKSLGKVTADAKSSVGGLNADTLESMAGSFGKIKASAGGAFDAVGKFVPSLGALTGVGVIAGMAKVVAGWKAFGSRIDLTAQRLGMPVEKLNQLQSSARLAGASAEDMSAGLAGLQATMADAVYGRNNQAANTFRNLGLDIGNARDGVKSLNSELPQIADATQQMFKVNPNAAARFLDQIGIGRQLMFVFKDGREGLARYNAESDKLGVVTKEQADAARALQLEQTRLNIALTQTGYAFAAEVGPDLIPLLKQVTGYVTGHREEINAFFARIGKGIREFFDPDSLRQTGALIGGIVDKVGGLLTAFENLSNNWLVKKLFSDGADPDKFADKNIPGMSFIDNLASKVGLGRNYDEQAFTQFPESRRRGRSAASDPQSLDYNANAPGIVSRVWNVVSGKEHMPYDPNVDRRANAAESWQFWKGKGLPDETVAELLGGEQGESGMNPTERGDSGTAGGAHQWHRDRRDAILRATGIDVWQEKNHKRQLEATYREMTGRIDPGAGRAWDKLIQPHAFGAGVDTLVDDFERSKNRASDKDKRRGFAAEYYRMFHEAQSPSQQAAPPVRAPSQDAIAPARRVPREVAASLESPVSDNDVHAAISAKMKLDMIRGIVPTEVPATVERPSQPATTPIKPQGQESLAPIRVPPQAALPPIKAPFQEPLAPLAPLEAPVSDNDAQAARSAKMRLEIIHRNAPLGTQVKVDASDAPDVTVMPMRTERSMPMGTGGSGY